ncbi:hypothetical protein SKAU_G00275790 [Synaphobranchus kaupii]|uniref:L1 transposable element RRM domain-containing protein n=1 Tax=Synaphobranchus kaupii TaxID=118154 RepID=A0A9Q1IQ59_SYNKA|nr:hypothetical protein SKAU_G00275790 [Synaphobranchus kaupii]
MSKHDTSKKPKDTRSLRSAVAKPNAKDASGGSESDMEDLSSAWEKISDKILKHINVRFDKLEETLQAVQSSQKELLEKVDDLEGRSRHNNIKIVGIPEREEGNKPAEFIAALIPKLLGEDNFQSSVIIDRAHRTLRSTPPEGAEPRAIIARVHFFQETELILRLRRARELEYKGNKVLIFPDYTPEVMRQRRKCNEVSSALRELKVEHSLLFPARLRIKNKGEFKAFTEPDEAMTFVNTDLKNVSEEH